MPIFFACCVGLQQIVCWGTLTYATAVYAAEMAARAQIGVASVMTAYGVGLLVNALVAGWCTRWVMRSGAFKPGLLGMALLIMSCGVHSIATDWSTLLLGFMLAGAAMALTQYDFAFLAVKLYTPAHARRVISVMTFFGALASTIMWPIALALSKNHGMPAGWRYLALIALVGSLPALYLYARLPVQTLHSLSSEPSESHAASPGASRSFAFIASLLGLAAIGTSLVANLPLVLAQMQVSSTFVASLLPLFGIGQLAARALDFAASRWLSSRVTLLACLICLLIALATSLMPQTTWLLSAAFVLLLGAGNGLATILRGVLPQQLYSGAQFTHVSSQLSSYGALLRAAMPVLVAQMAVLHGGMMGLSIGFVVLAFVSSWFLLQSMNPHRP